MKQADEATKRRVRRIARLILLTLLLGPVGLAFAVVLNRLDDRKQS